MKTEKHFKNTYKELHRWKYYSKTFSSSPAERKMRPLLCVLAWMPRQPWRNSRAVGSSVGWPRPWSPHTLGPPYPGSWVWSTPGASASDKVTGTEWHRLLIKGGKGNIYLWCGTLQMWFVEKVRQWCFLFYGRYSLVICHTSQNCLHGDTIIVKIPWLYGALMTNKDTEVKRQTLYMRLHSTRVTHVKYMYTLLFLSLPVFMNTFSLSLLAVLWWSDRGASGATTVLTGSSSSRERRNSSVWVRL